MWSFDFFSKNYGNLPVKVYDDSFSKQGGKYLKHTKEMTFGDYIKLITNGDSHLRLFLFDLIKTAPELKKHINIPQRFGKMANLNLFMFFGGVGATPPTHYDVDMPHVFHTVLCGQKEVYLFHPNQSYNLHQHPFTVRSYVDPRNPDLNRLPRFIHSSGWHCRLNEGETLLIPSGFWHKIYYQSPSFSISLRHYERKKIVKGIYNLLVNEKIDLFFNKVAKDKWFSWKQNKAGEIINVNK